MWSIGFAHKPTQIWHQFYRLLHTVQALYLQMIETTEYSYTHILFSHVEGSEYHSINGTSVNSGMKILILISCVGFATL